MKGSHSQRILNWLQSIGVLLLFCCLSFTAYWFYGRFNPVFDYYEADPAGSIWQLSESLLLYGLWFFPLALWHATNPLGTKAKTSGLLRASLSFRLFMGLSTIGMAAHSLAASGILTEEKCPNVPPPSENQAQFISCVFGPPDWLAWLSLAMLLAVTLIAIGKTTIALYEILKRSK